MPLPRPLVPWLVPVLIAAMLGGCAEEIAPPTDAPAPPRLNAFGNAEQDDELGFGSLPWNWTDCDVLLAVIPVSVEKLRPFLPDGFEPAPFGILIAPIPGTSFVGLEMFRCGSAEGLEGEITEAAYGSIFTAAKPPDGAPWEAEGEETYVKWDTLVPDEARRSRLITVGAPAHAGEVALGSLAGAARGSLTFEGAGGFEIDALDARTSRSGAAFAYVEYTPTESGLVGYIGRVVAASGSQGNGRVTLAEGMWLEDMLGARSLPAMVMSGSWSFTEGRVEYRSAGLS